MSQPFRLEVFDDPVPRALPWAMLSHPFRVKMQNTLLQPSLNRHSCEHFYLLPSSPFTPLRLVRVVSGLLVSRALPADSPATTTACKSGISNS